jgi:hypothetical protein
VFVPVHSRLEELGDATVYASDKTRCEREGLRDGEGKIPAPWVEEPKPDAIGEGNGVSVVREGWRRWRASRD